MKRLFPFIALLVSTFAYSQRSETRSLPSFTEVSVAEAIHLVISEGNKEEAEIQVSGTDLDHVITEVSGGKLKIHMEGKRNFNNAKVNIKLTYKNLNGIFVSSAADLESTGPIKSDRLRIEVSSAGDADLDVDVRELDIRVSSSGDLDLRGRATIQSVRVSSSGDYDAYDLTSESAEIEASSSGDARVTVSERIDAQASSSGTVYYKGDPEKVFANSSSSGRVRKS
ncbi:MAG: DUF2807 domain-containing protein [Cyclobacteriaceae bacterium]|nr:DUF2807 domain-containing protein [Cyclobacteriaceae bacterium HetDA_MAG_MS6]